MENCVNHPNKKALSACHGCGKHYCESCLDEGKEFYYCKNSECQELFKKRIACRIITDGSNLSKLFK